MGPGAATWQRLLALRRRPVRHHTNSAGAHPRPGDCLWDRSGSHPAIPGQALAVEGTGGPDMSDVAARLIDRWFPVGAVDEACRTPAGSGLTEKALFTWFASRPIAQARAAALTALLPQDVGLKDPVDAAVRRGDRHALRKL